MVFRPAGDSGQRVTGQSVRRPDQVMPPSSSAITPAALPGPLVNPTVIVTPGKGIFIYNGAPGPGTLIASITPPGTHADRFGNPVFGTISSYSGTLVATLLQNALQVTTNDPSSLITIGGTLSMLTDALAASTAPAMQLHSPQANSGASAIAMQGESQDGSKQPQILVLPGPISGHSWPAITSALLEVQGALAVTSGGAAVTGGLLADTVEAATLTGVAQNFKPGTNTPETWHSFTPASGTGTGCAYRLTAEGDVQLTGSIAYTSPTSPTSIFTLPSGYFSALNGFGPIPCGVNIAAYAAGAARVDLTTTGLIQFFFGGSASGAVTVSLDGITFPLSAG